MLLPLCSLSACGGASGPSSGQASAQDVSVDGRQTIAAATSGIVIIRTPMSPGPIGTDPPVVFNASSSARAGELAAVQGHNFGSAPKVYLEADPTHSLPIVNKVGTIWLTVQLPANATPPMRLRISNGSGTSARVALDAARPTHLDALQLVPGGRFRVFGHNLLVAGARTALRVDKLAATIDLVNSNEHMLIATAPAGVLPNANAVVTVANGNGSDAVTLPQTVQVTVTAAGPGAGNGAADPYALGVGWTSAFSTIASNVIDSTSDSRLPQKVVCNGSQDITPALQSAVDLAASQGGATVRLPAGNCRLNGNIAMRSNVVLEGAGKTATTLVYGSNYAIYGVGLDRVGLRRLTLANAGTVEEGPLLKDSTRVVVQQVAFQLGRSRQMYFSGNRNFVFVANDVKQTGSISQQGPYTFYASAGLVFEGNNTQWMDGAPAFGRIHDAYVGANQFTRDGGYQNNPGGTVHSFTIDFAYRIAVIGNVFDVAHGPITNKTRNDGETILTEGGATGRTENIGSVQAATATTLTDAANSLAMDPFGEGVVPENYGVAIVAGRGTGQTRRVTAYAAPTLTVERAWDVTPDATSKYATFVWGLEQALIKNNVLAQNPRGIWLYHTAVRDVDVIGNQISEGGGIYLRSYQNLADKRFMPMFNVAINDNKVSNTAGQWMSYINSVFVNSDARAFGVATIGIEMRRNQLRANVPNVESQWEEYAGVEGIMNMMRVENYNGYESMAVPRQLGTLIDGNSCTLCNVAVRVGTGAGGTTIVDTQWVQSGQLLDDWATTSNSAERSTDTVVH